MIVAFHSRFETVGFAFEPADSASAADWTSETAFAVASVKEGIVVLMCKGRKEACHWR